MNHIHKIKDMYIKFAIYNAKDFIITKIQNKNTNMTHQERIENESITISDEEIIENENNLEALEDYVIPITPSMILTVANLLTDHIELLKEESTNKMLDTKIINELERLTNQINDSYGGRNIIKPKQSLSVSSRYTSILGAIDSVILLSVTKLKFVIPQPPPYTTLNLIQPSSIVTFAIVNSSDCNAF